MRKAKYLVLDHGHVVVDRVSDSEADIARRLFGDRGAKAPLTKALLTYLLERDLAGPLGFPELVMYVYAPEFIRTSLFQVRTAWRSDGQVTLADPASDQFGESLADPSARVQFYAPPERSWLGTEDRARLQDTYQRLIDLHQSLVRGGLDPAHASLLLPPTRYVGWWWKQNLWHLLQWLRGLEHRTLLPEAEAYASVIRQIVAEHFPTVYSVSQEIGERVYLTRAEREEALKALKGRAISQRLADTLRDRR